MDIDIEERNIQGSTRDFVFSTMKKNIINLKIEPGAKIAENEISEILKVSRTPIREAFVKLSEEELVDIYPQKGSFVSLIDFAHVEEGRFARENLESAIIKLACEVFTEDDLFDMEELLEKQRVLNNRKNITKLFEIDEEFHRTLFSKCGKARTWLSIQQMQTHFNRVRLLLLSENFDWELILAQHTQIIKCIRNKDPKQAEVEMRDHLRLVVIENGRLREKFPNYFK